MANRGARFPSIKNSYKEINLCGREGEENKEKVVRHHSGVKIRKKNSRGFAIKKKRVKRPLKTSGAKEKKCAVESKEGRLGRAIVSRTSPTEIIGRGGVTRGEGCPENQGYPPKTQKEVAGKKKKSSPCSLHPSWAKGKSCIIKLRLQ